MNDFQNQIQLLELPAVKKALLSDEFMDKLAEKIVSKETEAKQRSEKLSEELTDKQVADRLRCSVRKVQRLKKSGKIDTVRIKGVLKIRECDLLKYQGIG